MKIQFCFVILMLLLLRIFATPIIADEPTKKTTETKGENMKSLPVVEVVEVVADQVLVGDGGNNWGGHQTRIVHTKEGVFTAYTTGKSDPPGSPWIMYDGAPRYWKLAIRKENGWQVMAEGLSGREPVNLMAGPDGKLYIVAWPGGLPHLYSGRPSNGTIKMEDTAIPGPWQTNNWPYNSAGISNNGDIALVQSATGDVPGRFIWGYRSAKNIQWQSGEISLQQRHCYSYVLPEIDGRMSITSTRDVLTSAMGYEKGTTKHSLGYVFNRLGYCTTEEVIKKPFNELQVAEAIPSKEFPEVNACGTCGDTYLDTKGRMHLMYFYSSPETKGHQYIQHSIVENGKVIKTVQLPDEIGAFCKAPIAETTKPQYCRIIQDTTGRFYLIGTSAIIPCDSEDGATLGKPVPLDLKGFAVEYSGIAIAAPRGGTPLSDVVDAVFPTDTGKKVIYIRIRLR